MSSIDNSELKTLLQRKVAILELGEFQPFFQKTVFCLATFKCRLIMASLVDVNQFRYLT